MTDLNLMLDDPDEYEGRIVRWNSAEYVIGPWVGEGGERFVLELTNQKSGLTLFLIKILRDQEFGAEIARAMHESWTLAPDLTVPAPELVFAHGGWFEIAEAANDERDPHSSATAEARSRYGAGQLDIARDICTAVLEANEFHTCAHHLVSRIAASEGQYDDAIEVGYRAISIEPNCRPYWITLMDFLARRSRLLEFESLHKIFKRKWPFEHRINPLVAEVYLRLGRPEEALELALPESPELRSRISSDAALAQRARVLEEQAFELLKTAPDRVVGVLSSAHSLYQGDRLISLNLGLALARVGRCREARRTVDECRRRCAARGLVDCRR